MRIDPAGRYDRYVVLGPLVLICAAGAAYVYLSTAVTNVVWNHARLGRHRFVSSLAFVPMLVIHATSLIAIVGSAGLAIPWARVRLARYRAAPDAPRRRRSRRSWSSGQ
jgi:uncharacterized membrane protein YjgN (DUF898 family)